MEKSYLPQFDKVTIISKRMSGDKKYRTEKDGRTYLLRSAEAALLIKLEYVGEL